MGQARQNRHKPIPKEKRARHYERTLYHFAKRSPDGTFTMSSEWEEQRYGHDYNQTCKHPLIQAGKLKIVLKEYFIPNTPGKGRCRTYKYSRDIETDLVLSPDEEQELPPDFLDLCNATNIRELTPFLWQVDGRNGDARVYNSFTSLTHEQKEQLRFIDAPLEPIVQIDLVGAFPYLLGKSIKAGAFYSNVVENGVLYELLVAGVKEAFHITIDRENAKIAVQRILNDPRKRLAFGRYDDGRRYATTDEKEQAKAARVFRWLFPKEYKAFRNLARQQKGLAFRMGSQKEAAFRTKWAQMARENNINIILAHDAFWCKLSDAEHMMKLIQDMPASFKLTILSNSSTLLHLISRQTPENPFFDFVYRDSDAEPPPKS